MDEKAIWDREVAELEAWFEGVAPHGDVLELACGTGIWTAPLAAHAGNLTAVDSSSKAIALNRSRFGSGVDYVLADLFEWRPPARYDAVFFSFWLSHVPPDRWAGFWDLVRSALRPDGVALWIDNLWRPGDWPAAHPAPDEYVQERSDLTSGERFRIVKRYYEPDELNTKLAVLGWRAETSATDRFFIYGTATVA